MVNELINGIATALKAYPGVSVYDRPVEQGVELPCFIIEMPQMAVLRRLHGHYSANHPFSINYLGVDLSAVRAVAESLPLAIETINMAGIEVHGTDIAVTVDEEKRTAHCDVNYKTTFKREKAKEYMQAINYSGGVK